MKRLRASKFLYLALGLGLSTQAFASGPKAPDKADEPSPATDKNSVTAQKLYDWIFDKVATLGVDHVANLSTLELRESLRNIRIQFLASIFLAGSGGHRGSEAHFVKERIVYLSDIAWKQSEAHAQTLLFLHGGLGAAGYNDENYALSLALWFMAYAPNRAEAADFAKRLDAIFAGTRYTVSTDEPIYQPDTPDVMTGRKANVDMGQFAKPGTEGAMPGGGGDSEEISTKEYALLASTQFLPAMQQAGHPVPDLTALQAAILFAHSNITQDLKDRTMRIDYLPGSGAFAFYTSIQVSSNRAQAAAALLVGLDQMLVLPVGERTRQSIDPFKGGPGENLKTLLEVPVK